MLEESKSSFRFILTIASHCNVFKKPFKIRISEKNWNLKWCPLCIEGNFVIGQARFYVTYGHACKNLNKTINLILHKSVTLHKLLHIDIYISPIVKIIVNIVLAICYATTGCNCCPCQCNTVSVTEFLKFSKIFTLFNLLALLTCLSNNLLLIRTIKLFGNRTRKLDFDNPSHVYDLIHSIYRSLWSNVLVHVFLRTSPYLDCWLVLFGAWCRIKFYLTFINYKSHRVFVECNIITSFE